MFMMICMSICIGILMKKAFPKLLFVILLTARIPWMPIFQISCYRFKWIPWDISGILTMWVKLSYPAHIPYFQDIPRKFFNLVETDRKCYKSCSIVNPMWAISGGIPELPTHGRGRGLYDTGDIRNCVALIRFPSSPTTPSSSPSPSFH